MKEMMKDGFSLFCQNPSAFFCLICIAGTGYIYNDFKDFIHEQQVILKEISRTQSQIQIELKELNVRLQKIEKEK